MGCDITLLGVWFLTIKMSGTTHTIMQCHIPGDWTA